MTAAKKAFDAGTARPFLSNDRVRWADVDLVGIMRFSAFTRLVENAEQDLWREAGLGYQKITDNPSVWMPRRNLSIEYTSPAKIDDVLQLVTYVSRLGESSVVFNVDVMTEDSRRLYAAAEMVTVCVNARTFTKEPLPAETRTAMAPFVMTMENARAWIRDNMIDRGREQKVS